MIEDVETKQLFYHCKGIKWSWKCKNYGVIHYKTVNLIHQKGNQQVCCLSKQYIIFTRDFNGLLLTLLLFSDPHDDRSRGFEQLKKNIWLPSRPSPWPTWWGMERWSLRQKSGFSKSRRRRGRFQFFLHSYWCWVLCCLCVFALRACAAAGCQFSWRLGSA